MIDRDLEEALDLARVEVHGQHAVDADPLQALGDDPGGDGLARRRLLVLARVAEPWHDRDDPVRGGALRRVDHHHQLHQRVVGGHPLRGVGRRGLHEEDVGAADRLVVAAVDLAVREGPQVDVADVDVEVAGDPRGQLHRAPPAEHHQPLGVVLRDRADHLGALLDGAHESFS